MQLCLVELTSHNVKLVASRKLAHIEQYKLLIPLVTLLATLCNDDDHHQHQIHIHEQHVNLS